MSNFCLKCLSYIGIHPECYCKPFKVLDLDSSEDEPEEFFSRCDDLQYVAEDYAERYFHCRDYPNEFNLQINGEKFHVEVDLAPVFRASKIEERPGPQGEDE